MKEKMKPVAAHFDYPVFLPKSETFIYQYISHFNRFKPVCLSWGFDNLDQFVIPPDDLCLLSFRKFTPKWFYYGVQRRLCYNMGAGFYSRDRASERIAHAFLRQRQVKLIHAHFGTTGVLTFRLKKSLGVPHITTFYGFDVSKLARDARWLELYNSLFLEGDLFLVEGFHMRSKLKALGCPEEKIRIQRIAIPVDHIAYRARMSKKKGEKTVIIFGGRFVEKKGLIYALRALKEVRTKYRDFEFRIIGDGPLKNEIVEFIERNRMGDYVRLFGLLGYHNYLKEMQDADVFLHPSVTASDGDSEGGAPTTILEAQAMGMPVVSSYHADISNIVIPGKSALLSDEKDWKGLAENISNLLGNQGEWKEMGSAGRSFVEEYHDIKKEVITLESKYLSLVNEVL